MNILFVKNEADQKLGVIIGNPHELTDTKESTEGLFSISVETKKELNETIQKVKLAGGFVFGESIQRNELYGAGFEDLDIYRWNLLVM